MNLEQLQQLASRGVIVPEYAEFLPNGWNADPNIAFDAAPVTVTAQNAGIPAYLANLLDKERVRVLVTPMKAAQACGAGTSGEVKKGDWTTLSTQFPMVESTGEVSSYGDYNNNGFSGVNYNWVSYQSYHWQTIVGYGDRETEIFGLAAMNYVADKNYSADLLMAKFMNQTYLYGVAGMQNRGMLNDPSLLSPISPTTKAAGGYTWAVATALEILNDFLAMYVQMQTQMPALLDRDTKLTVALPQTVEPYLDRGTTLDPSATARKAIEQTFKNLRIITIPEYATAAGNLVQFIVDEVDGIQTAYCAFTEKMRAGPVIPDLSSKRQKKTAGSWGTIIRRPVAIVQMLGV